jgi:hypothetical protein
MQNLSSLEMNYVIPDNFREIILKYIKGIRGKNGELDKRAFMKSVLMEDILKITPEFIGFEEKRNDIYFAGIIVETKNVINEKQRQEGLSELKRYTIEREKNEQVSKCILTDCINFEVYSPADIKNEAITKLKPKWNFNIEDFVNSDKRNLTYLFNNLYILFHPKLEKGTLKPTQEMLVPRLLHLSNQLYPKIQNRDPGIKFYAWLNYISKVFGDENEGSKELYFRHAILFYYSLFVVARALGINKNRKDILNGNVFVSKGILNFVDEDNFFDFLEEDDEIFDDIENELDNYNLSEKVQKDIFRVLYEYTVSPNERHNLGEFYTPEWLAKILVDELVTKDNVILDPACGSGTFLKLALEKKINLESSSPASQVIGFDINPIAVIVSKANYLLEIKDFKNLNIIPVFLADSLMPNINLEELHSNKYTNSITINFEEIVEGYGQSKFFYKSNYTPNEMNKYLLKMKDNLGNKSKLNKEFKDNKELLKKLNDLVIHGKDHIWFFILKNIYTPYYYCRKVDIVIGNPPWLTYHDVKDPKRQKQLDILYKEYKMNAGAQNKTHIDYAGFFIARSTEFLKNNGKIGFVLTRSVLNGAQYNGLRSGTWNINKFKIDKVWDISQKVNPFRKPACIVTFSKKQDYDISESFIIDTDIKKLKNNSIFSIGSKDIYIKPIKFYLNKTRNFSGISDSLAKSNKPSEYKEIFGQGANIVPRPYFFVNIIKEEKYAYIVTTMKKYTTEKNKRTSKGDYKFSFNNFNASKQIVYPIVLGESVKKFKYEIKNYAVLPIINRNFIFNQEKTSSGYIFKLNEENVTKSIKDPNLKEIEIKLLKRYESEFNNSEMDWEAHRKDKFSLDGKNSASSSLFNWINWNNKLLKQNSDFKYAVIYNMSGKDIRSAVITGRVIIDYELYYSYFDIEEEAYYVCGILNSKYLIEELRKFGILSERHITKKPFDIDIPKYGKSKELLKYQNSIAELAKNLHMLDNKTKIYSEKFNELNDIVERLFNSKL